MVSDFFYPNVYYLPLKPVYNQCIMPTVFTTLPIIRNILIREQITIIHGHSAFSALALESMYHGATMGIKTVFTDHSLFGFADASSIIMNKLLKAALISANHVICVSNTSKENTVLRAAIKPHLVSVIPNAVDATVFTPDPSKRQPRKITIVTISRLVYRKGTDFLATIIPEICSRHPDVQFIIGGDGPKRLLVEEVRENYQLQDRVQMLGMVDHSKVRDVCTMLLQVVSTRVGGVPEVLPPDLIRLVEPSAKALVAELESAIIEQRTNQHMSPYAIHSRVRELYKWQDVAKRTELVYDRIAREREIDLAERLHRYSKCGLVAGKVFILLAVLNYLLLLFIQWWRPSKYIDIAYGFPSPKKTNKGQ
ncbi:hypothetical protein LSH36_77g02003 [Paralvinella palmiformis]|uniref:Uncharacterized protein n=1 Tax=Paralvinella palmiformis TaxID=53620 RepID=A0AAD9K263_9ANNE|nr:hypothetical protein LSH36_77g02003 [Paralvinella palmiformis]